MTALNATVVPHAAWMSCDSLWSELLEGALPDFFTGTGDQIEEARQHLAPAPGTIRTREVGHAPKFQGYHRARTLIGGTGHAWAWGRWLTELTELDPASVEEIVDTAPERLAVLSAEAGKPLSFAVVILGWSAGWGRALGWVLSSSDGFRPQPIPDRDHAFAPPPQCSPAESKYLSTLLKAVAQGKQVEAFHKALLRSQARVARKGGYLGGALQVAGTGYLGEVSEAGVSYRAIVEL